MDQWKHITQLRNTQGRMGSEFLVGPELGLKQLLQTYLFLTRAGGRYQAWRHHGPEINQINYPHVFFVSAKYVYCYPLNSTQATAHLVMLSINKGMGIMSGS